MKQLLHVVIPIQPLAVQSVRSRAVKGVIMHYQPAKVVRWKGEVRRYVQEHLPDGWEVLDRPIALKYVLRFPMLKTMPKKLVARIKAGETVYKATKPDNDNCMKGLNDSLNKLIWKDDAIIVRSLVDKIFAEEPNIEITVYDI